MPLPTPPIFVIEGRDVTIFESLEDAQLQVEPIDVLEGVYVAYDAEGRILRMVVEGDQVKVRLGEDEPTHAEELSRILKDYLKELGELTNEESTHELSRLVEACRKFTHVLRGPTEILRESARRIVDRVKNILPKRKIRRH
jgi:hypothetical protein